jgi:hypothetical protein
MKKLLQLGAIFCGLLITQYGYSAQDFRGGAPADHACGDTATGECYCLYCHYQPCNYTTRRCVEDVIPCKKRCCRYVDKYYEVQRCRMVPQYYTETCCTKCPEYYEVEECKTCKRWVCDTHCKYVPQYYWKHTCNNQPQDAGVAAPSGGCGPGGCSAR